VQVPPCQFIRFGHVAISQFVEGNPMFIA
jgi:hypothetical protein